MKLLCRMLGGLLLFMAVALLPPVGVAAADADGSLLAVAASAAGMAAAGLALRAAGRGADYAVGETAGYWYTSLLWLLVPLAGTAPYLAAGLFGGGAAAFANALFESVSGFTTTGATTIDAPGSVPRSLLLWRAETQWMGGLGLVLLVVALSRRLRSGSAQLYDAEFSGTQQRKLHPHLSRSVSRMWQIYIVLTLAAAALLHGVGRTGLFDAACLAMSAVSTGGFMPAPPSALSEPALYVLACFMLASGINIALLYNFVSLRWRRIGRNSELLLYLALFGVATAVVWASLQGSAGGGGRSALAVAVFHVASTISTTGLVAQTGMRLPRAAAAVTFALMVVGPMAGSTGGGLKLKRVMVLAQYLKNYFTRMLHPQAVFCVRIDRRAVEPAYVDKIFGFLFLFVCVLIGGAFALTCCGLGIADAFCLAAANLSNLGPSPLVGVLGEGVGYGGLPVAAKCTLMALMLAGRLEIFALLAIVSPSYWHRKR